MKYEYTLIRSKRRTLSLQLKGDELIVRAPKRVSKREIDDFVQRHDEWIEKHRSKIAQREAELSAVPKLSEAELSDLTRKALEYIPARVEYYAANMGLSYGRITLRCQKTRWGSCSAKKNLNFNILLMLTPPEVIDSVVVHELCHLKEMNHSDRFYKLVYATYPDYDRCNKWLKQNGAAIMARVDR
jgi:predicted metal-dependent hydrolase